MLESIDCVTEQQGILTSGQTDDVLSCVVFFGAVGGRLHHVPDSNILYMCTPHDMYDSSCSSSMQDECVSTAVVVAIFVKDTLGSKQVIADVAI